MMGEAFWRKLFHEAHREVSGYRYCKMELWIMRGLWLITLLYVLRR